MHDRSRVDVAVDVRPLWKWRHSGAANATMILHLLEIQQQLEDGHGRDS